ncbi:transient receptor potential cation channel subfamily A member 1 homolog isoform X2 [Mya arenaria]|uniref:transient receptor potential cation channel subfamily A member 1 homolog isoform X2 n=1 Tax=Mya arenaria TaxID=6604 RepID=UPI0022E21051|nr:transient receptor potential cation channel subfamily A member 1 homolog isoform X2 [Mya arenaria]
MKGNVEAAELLLKSEKIDVDCEDEDGNTPLMLASKYGNEELMDLLIVENNHNNKNGMTALHYAALYGKTNAVVKLLRHGPKQLANKVTRNKKTAFHLACENNNLECAKELQAGKCAQETRDAPDANGFTPFMHAVAKGFEKLVYYLMDCGDIDPCVRLGDGRNILHIVAEKNRSTVLKILLDKTSNNTLQRERTAQMSSINKIQKLLNAQDNESNKSTPLHTASQFGHVKVFEILLKYGANPFLPDAYMKTPLHIASEKGFTSIIENMALQNHEFLNKTDVNGDTVYHLAAKEGHARLLDVLLREDKENNFSKVKNKTGCTSLWLAAASGHLKCVEHLSTQTDLIDMANENKLTPLMVASKNGHADVVEYMILKQSNVSLLDEKGHNCLEIAILNRHESVAMTIIESNQWEKALRNYTKDDDGMECTPFRKLVRHMPDTAKASLDRCIYASAEENGTKRQKKDNACKNERKIKRIEYLARFNFEFIDDLYFIKEWSDQSSFRTRDMEATKTQYSYKRTDTPEAYENDADLFKVQHPMIIMSEAGLLNLLVHPVVKGLRQHKWSRFAKSYYYVFFVIYALYLSFLTTYVVMTPPPFAINQSSCEEYFDTGYRRPLALHVVKTFLYVLTSINVFKELIQLFMRRLNYFNFVNIMEIIIFVTSFLFVIDFDGCQYYTNYRYTFQWNLGAVSILLSWFGIVMYLQKWPDIGIYVVMFNNILRTLVKFFIVFVLFIVGFGLGFFCLLQNQTPFSTAPYAILRTTVMMIGELDFNAVFHDDVVHYWITYVFFCIFLIVMTIVIMNLMIGLAIDDIKAVQDHATLKGIQMKVKLVLDVERLLLSVSKYRLGGYWIWPPGWYIDVYVKRFKSAEYMKIALSKDADKYENQVEVNQHKMMHKQKTLKKAMKTMKIEMDKQGVLLEEIKRKLFEETKT